MPDHNVHFSSEKSDWETPDDFFAKYHAIYNFEIDVAASPENTKCPVFFSKEQDCLKQDWGTRTCWMNPPYGDPEHPCKRRKDGSYNCKKKKCKERGHHNDVYIPGIIDFMRKAYQESLKGATVVCLVPSRTDTEWFQDYAMKGEIEFIRGRLQFVGAATGAPFPSAVVVFRSATPGEAG